MGAIGLGEDTQKEQVEHLIKLKDDRLKEIKKLHEKLVRCERLSTIRRLAVEALIAAGKFTQDDWNAALQYIGKIYSK